MLAEHAELTALEAAEQHVALARSHHGWPGVPPLDGRFIDGVEVLSDGTELHLASFGMADAGSV